MAYTGNYRTGFGTFNNQTVGDAFSSAVKRANPGFQGLGAGQYFTGEDGTRYKTVSGIDPNKPGWGNQVDPDYQLIGYMPGAPISGRARGMGIQPNPGVAILRKSSAPAAAAAPVAQAAPPQAAPPAAPQSAPDVDPGPSRSDFMLQSLQDSIAAMQQGFMQSMQQNAQQFQQMQQAQNERMEALQQMMIQSQASQAERPTVAGVKSAVGQSGTPMQIARRGVSGSFGRRGMRMKNINV